MTVPERLTDGAQAAREYAKGIDRAVVRRGAFAFVMVFILSVSIVGAQGTSLVLGDGFASDDFEDNDIVEWDKPADRTNYEVGTTNVQEGQFALEQNLTQSTSGVERPLKSNGTLGLKSGEDFSFTFHMYIEDEVSDSQSNFGLLLTDGQEDIYAVYDPDSDRFEVAGSILNADINGLDPSLGQYYELEVVVDYGTSEVEFFVDGQSQGTTTTAASWANEDDIELWIQSDLNSGGTGYHEYWYDGISIDGVATANHTVSGTVTYESNGTVVEDASISVNASTVSDSTDASGNYTVALDNGTYEITAIKDPVDGPQYTGSITVEVNGSDVTGADITLTRSADLSLDVPTQMFPNETASYEVNDVQADGSKIDVTENATVTSSDPTNLTVNQTSHELESTSDTSFSGEITITAEFEDDEVSRNVTVANLSAENVGLMQNAADMTAAIWGDVPGPSGDRPGGTQLTMRILFVALLIGAAIATHASGFAGIGGITLIVVMGWFMGWVSDGMTLVTVFTGLFIGLNLAANIDYTVRND